jgi:UDP-glucose 6-dehydrogenase
LSKTAITFSRYASVSQDKFSSVKMHVAWTITPDGDMQLVVVGTPPDEDGSADLLYAYG